MTLVICIVLSRNKLKSKSKLNQMFKIWYKIMNWKARVTPPLFNAAHKLLSFFSQIKLFTESCFSLKFSSDQSNIKYLWQPLCSTDFSCYVWYMLTNYCLPTNPHLTRPALDRFHDNNRVVLLICLNLHSVLKAEKVWESMRKCAQSWWVCIEYDK